MKKVVLITFVFVLLLSQWGLTASKNDPYLIGAFLSISGPNAPLGTPERDTLLMVQDKINKSGGINGRPIKVIIEDDATDPTNAVRAVKKLIDQDNVIALIGGTGTGSAAAAVNLISQAKRPFVTVCAGTAGVTEPVNPWVFRVPQTNRIMIKRIAEYLSSLKLTKVAMIYDSNAFGTDGRDKLRLQAPLSGLTIVDEESFNSKDTDFTVQLTKAANSGARAIICWGTNPAPAILAKNKKQLGIHTSLIMCHGVANATFLELAGTDAEGITLPCGKIHVAKNLPASDPQRKVLLEYASEFKARFNRTADPFGGHSWDALYIIAAAIKKAGTDPAKLRDAIEATRGFVGIDGIISYSPTQHDGPTEDSVVMMKVVGGKWSLIWK